MNWLKQQVANVAGTQEPVYGPSALRSVAEEAKTTPYTELKREDLKWVAPTYTCVETQTFYFFAKSGHIGSTQVIYNSLAGLRTTTQFNTKVWYPDASKQPLWSSDPLYNHGFSDDRTAFHADNCSITLNESGDSYAIKSTTNTLSVVDLKVKRIAPGFVAGNTGVSHFGIDPENPWGSMWHKFWPRCEGEGGIMTKEGEVDFAGSRVLFIHALQGMKPHHAAARWNFVDFQGPDYSAVMMEFTTPPSYGSSTVNVGCIVKGSEILYAGCTNTAKHVEAKKDTENDWPEPSAVEFKWAGKAADGTELSAELIGSLGERLDKIDVMAEVPGFVKTFVGHAVGTKPYIYQYSPQPKLKLKLELGGEKHEEEGETFSEATFISA